uniref:Uncharacterized protein n=1 Tax=Tetranychus urticae TaxID=32264 RepID=T1JQY6_TETUR
MGFGEDFLVNPMLGSIKQIMEQMKMVPNLIAFGFI